MSSCFDTLSLKVCLVKPHRTGPINLISNVLDHTFIQPVRWLPIRSLISTVILSVGST